MPINLERCAPPFAERVRQVLATIPIVGCGQPDCEHCKGDPDDVLELGHFARKPITHWRKRWPGIGAPLNWCDTLADRSSGLYRTTGLGGCTDFQQLCLIRIGSCRPYDGDLARVPQDHSVHYGVQFDIASEFIAKLRVEGFTEGRDWVYRIV